MQQDVIPPALPLRTRDGLNLHWRDWPVESPRTVTVLVHGLGEHIGRYEHVAARLNDWGHAVCGYDHRGHGRSQGPRGILQTSDDLLLDLALAIDRARARYPGRPMVLFGHSLGGLVSARFVAEGLAGSRGAAPLNWVRPVEGLVMSSPALDPGMSSIQRALLATLGRAAPNVAVPNGVQPERICRDPAVVAAYRADPLVHDQIAGRLARFIVDAGEQVARVAPQWSLPTLLLYASEEKVVDPAGSARFTAAAPAAWVATQAFPGLAHEIFNEPEQDQVFQALADWLGERFDPTRAAAA